MSKTLSHSTAAIRGRTLGEAAGRFRPAWHPTGKYGGAYFFRQPMKAMVYVPYGLGKPLVERFPLWV